MTIPAWNEEVAIRNTQALNRIIGIWERQDELRANLEGRRGKATPYARSALERELGKLAAAPEGERNNQLNQAAFALGQLVASGALDRPEVERSLATTAERIGLAPSEITATVRSGIEAGMKEPRQTPGPRLSANGRHRDEDGPVKEIAEEDVATIDDLIRAGAEVRWLWEGWIQVGVLTAVAALGGTGKTRFCADLVRRIRHGLPWPDGKPMDLPPETRTIWVVSDNHHDEMVTLARAFDVKDSIWLNAPKSDPYAGTTLDEREDLRDLEARIKAVKPAIVVIDTVGNSTDRNLSKQEDAKAYYLPLQVLARKYRCAILCLTHLNANGHFLGRRVLEKVRVAIRMEQPGKGDERRRIDVAKTNARTPAPLGVTMGDSGNEYDSQPPAKAESAAECPSPRLDEACEWLTERLTAGPRRVSAIRTEAEMEEISAPILYRAKDRIGVEEFSSEGKKWWQLMERHVEP